MKKFMFLLPVAALALASCSSDSVVEQPATKVVSAEALQIFPDIQGVTRGELIDNGNFDQFKLTTDGKFQTNKEDVNADDAAAFDGEIVHKVSGTWYIGKDNTTQSYYWPNKSASSSFTAWAPVTEPAGGSYTDEGDIAKQRDIVVAFNKGTATEFESGVPLKFRHILSQIVVMADNEASSKIQIKVKGIRLNAINATRSWSLPTTSTVDALPDGIWKPVSTRADKDYVANFTAEKTLTGTAQEITGDNPILLIPQQLETANIKEGSGQYLSVLVQIQEIKTGGNNAVFPAIGESKTISDQHFAWAAVDINTLWEAGKKYIYTLHFTENGYGKVDSDQNGSDDEDDGTGEDDPDAGDDVVDTPVPLVLDVKVIDWEEGDADPNEYNM